MESASSYQKPGQVVFTNKGRCRDCYRCLRSCPIKAIRVTEGQAFVASERCLACGTCIRECPQHAKSHRADAERVIELIASPGPTAASIAPSFAAILSPEDQERLPEALRRLGFSYVAETAVGAYDVAKETAAYISQRGAGQYICTACPAVVRYVECYEPDLVNRLVPVLSPMFAHAKRIKSELGSQSKVVFIGPCVAKKAESDRAEHHHLVDASLTFAELLEMLEHEGVALNACPSGRFDDEPGGESRFYPLPGGLARTAAFDTDLLGSQCIPISGFNEIRQAFEQLRQSADPIILEPLFCPQGCINGPGMPERGNLFQRRAGLLHYARTRQGRPAKDITPHSDLSTQFRPSPISVPDFDESAILSIFEHTGKANPSDQLNCGACGYGSCRDQALAVLNNMAAPEMCIPYMRRLAERRTDKIIETSPNGVVIVDEQLRILHTNPALRSMFQCTESVLGKHISYLMDPEPFERVSVGREPLVDLTVRHEAYKIICHELIYRLPEEQQYVGIFMNITHAVASETEFELLRSETFRKAQQLMEHQVRMAQELAKYLGESTAQSEDILRNILSIVDKKRGRAGEEWRWDTSTSKP